MESSRLEASFGKWAVAIKVISIDGQRLRLPQAIIRNLLKFVSAVPLMLGYLIAIFTKRRQALHDILARAVLPLSV